MFKYYLKRIGNNQTIYISQRTWSILYLDRSIEVKNLCPTEFKELFKTVTYTQVAEAFSNYVETNFL